MAEELKVNISEPVEAQRLAVRIIARMGPDSGSWLSNAMSRPGAGLEDDAKEFLRACLSLGSELREEPDRYGTVDKVCRSILRRQRNGAAVSKDEYGAALGNLTRVQRRRLEKGEATLSYKNVTAICSGFTDKNLQRFWENQLLVLFPSISTAGRGGDVEWRGLRWLCTALGKSTRYKDILNSLDEADRESIGAIATVTEAEPPSQFGDKPRELYEVIHHLAGDAGLIIPALAEDQLRVRVNTWYAWRKEWVKAEKGGFKNGVPKNRLKRIHMMYMSALFGLDYYKSIWFLALAGYGYTPGQEPDDEVIRCLRDASGAKTRGELMEYLMNGYTANRFTQAII